MPLKPHQFAKPKRDAKIWWYRHEKKGEKFSLSQIAAIFHISSERVRVILKNEAKRRANLDEPNPTTKNR